MGGKNGYVKPSRMVAKRTMKQQVLRLEAVVTQLFVEMADMSQKVRDLAILTGHYAKLGIDPLEQDGVRMQDVKDVMKEAEDSQVDLEDAIAELEQEDGSEEE